MDYSEKACPIARTLNQVGKYCPFSGCCKRRDRKKYYECRITISKLFRR